MLFKAKRIRQLEKDFNRLLSMFWCHTHNDHKFITKGELDEYYVLECKHCGFTKLEKKS